MIILAIESSCDETSCALVRDGKEVLSNVVASQIEVHKQYGGVFPEIASRLHIENINYVIEEALHKADLTFADVDAIAVTQGPGLVGSLHVGVMAAKTLALSLDLPLIPVHHIAGHIYANILSGDLKFPLLALIVSGGHTELVYMQSHYHFEVLGKTQDDAVGEAYDKIARLMGLDYPGGPIIDKLAQKGSPRYPLPDVRLENPLDFSFSGLKSAVRQSLLREERAGRVLNIEDMAASFQEKAVGELYKRVDRALASYPVEQFVLAGGVAANSLVRKKAQTITSVEVLMPPIWACMDQAAMIGLAAYYAWERGIRGTCEMSPLSNMLIDIY